LSAKLSALRAGGRPLVILCAVTIILLVVQNIVGIAVATAAGAHPFYGLLIGSISFVGGPGTAAAWAQEAQSIGLARAPEVAVGAATLAVVVGAMVSGPITGWLVRRNHLHGRQMDASATWALPDEREPVPAPPISTIVLILLLILIAIIAGDLANGWARGAGLVLPGFLTAMLAGAVITNVADVVGARIDFDPIERGGEIALQAFLVMYLMSLKLWTLGTAIGPLALNVAAQILITVAIGIFLLFRWLGRDYDAAVTAGGFLGFGLSSMPVAMSTMDSVALRYGPSPKAFLLVALAGSFFVDLANALIVKMFLLLPMFA
jgi:ESS family glutamate:Na+ symporter